MAWTSITRRRLMMMAFACIGIVLSAAAFVAAVAYRDREASAVTTIGTLRVDYLLTPDESSDLGLRFGEDFDVTSTGTVVLSANDRLYEVAKSGDGPSAAALAFSGVAPESFAVDSGDTLLTVRDRMFGMARDRDHIAEAIPLPFAGMRLARSALPGTVFLFGGDNSNYRVYRFAEDGIFQVLLEIADPIVAVSDTPDVTYVATKDAIYRLKDENAVLAFHTRGEDFQGPIVSIAVAPAGDVLFFSTPSTVYAVRGAAAPSVITDSGGTLRLVGDRLYVLDRTRAMLYAAHPATSRLFE